MVSIYSPFWAFFSVDGSGDNISDDSSDGGDEDDVSDEESDVKSVQLDEKVSKLKAQLNAIANTSSEEEEER